MMHAALFKTWHQEFTPCNQLKVQELYCCVGLLTFDMLWSLVTVAVGDTTQSPETQSIGTAQRPDVARSIVHLTHYTVTQTTVHIPALLLLLLMMMLLMQLLILSTVNFWNLQFCFLSLFLTYCIVTKPVITGGGDQSTQRKSPPNPKSLATRNILLNYSYAKPKKKSVNKQNVCLKQPRLERFDIEKMIIKPSCLIVCRPYRAL